MYNLAVYMELTMPQIWSKLLRVHDPDMAGVTDQFDPDTDSIQRMGIQWENVQDDITFTLPERHACLAHTIQLVVNDGMKRSS